MSDVPALRRLRRADEHAAMAFVPGSLITKSANYATLYGLDGRSIVLRNELGYVIGRACTDEQRTHADGRTYCQGCGCSPCQAILAFFSTPQGFIVGRTNVLWFRVIS